MQIFGTNRDESGEWRSLHNEKLNILYCLRNIIRVVKSIRLRWADHIARMEEGRSVFKIFTGKPIIVVVDTPGRFAVNKGGDGIEQIGVRASE